MVVGVNHRTASLAVRERFWIGEPHRYAALRQLKSAEGIEEVIVLSTRCRTDFLVWAEEPTLAANSLVHYLSSQHGLKLSEWEHFYRRLDEDALDHIFRLASGVDCQLLCASEAPARVRAAWEQARMVGAAGPYLNAVMEKAFAVSDRVRRETASEKLGVSVPTAALELARQIFGSLDGRKILLLGAGEMSEASARKMAGSGAESLVVINQSSGRAEELAQQLGGEAATLADRWKWLLAADIVISASECPHLVLTRDEAEHIAAERNRVALLVIDLGMPRNVDPEVRRVDGVLLYDLEGLERSAQGHSEERAAEVAKATEIIAQEVPEFRAKLKAQSVTPIFVALRHRLDEICRTELDCFIQERGPFTREEDQSLHAITAQVTQKIANSLARELKELPEKEEQERMAAAVARLFHLNSAQATKSEKTRNEPNEKRSVAINY